ncbi:GNAT family N-acetyltransferase [Thalassococcus profundi]|uniref:GNAT family N-acetyltransferase n=2 Tax=Thalassococcus profundi TaxID=2282382 RepID=A0A369TK83_9RHOB|nr:GNAT family N-acetyltransferase [Thalassococcus profundi]
MRAQTPPDSCHVKTAEELTASGAQIFVLRDAEGAVQAIGAFETIGPGAVELKSMHTAEAARGQGLGRRLLEGLLHEARRAGADSAWLETGAEPGFAAARRLYESAGFVPCPPFAHYRPDPLSVFMTRRL